MNDIPRWENLRPAEYEQMAMELQMYRQEAAENLMLSPEQCWALLKKAWKRIQATQPGAPKRWKMAVRNAAVRGHSFLIPPSEYMALIEQPCRYCQGTVGNGIGLDRIRNKNPYTTDNVVPCCGPCNVSRPRTVVGITPKARPTVG